MWRIAIALFPIVSTLQVELSGSQSRTSFMLHVTSLTQKSSLAVTSLTCTKKFGLAFPVTSTIFLAVVIGSPALAGCLAASSDGSNSGWGEGVISHKNPHTRVWFTQTTQPMIVADNRSCLKDHDFQFLDCQRRIMAELHSFIAVQTQSNWQGGENRMKECKTSLRKHLFTVEMIGP